MRIINKFQPNNLTEEYLLNCFEYFKCLFSRKPRLKIYYRLIPYSIHSRRSGNTTRLVDKYIQDFFLNGECGFQDHYGTPESCRRVRDLVYSRLINEHGFTKKDLILTNNNRFLRNKKTYYEHNQK